VLPLILENVSFVAAGRAIIDGVSCELTPGPRTVILGPNGSGKSVLMRLCHGLLKPTSGRIAWQGSRDERRPRAQAMVFQRPVMLRRSALGNVTYGLKLAGVPRAERERRAREVVDAVGLSAVAHRPARVLSGGEQQKLALARAWALDPEVLFLDEPTANLDPGATREVERIVEQIHASGTKIVMTTHNLGQARRLADEILFMSGGRLADHAPVERFFAQPSTAEAAAFIKGELPWS
jgi:tungstate transport system ATP-binding protein